LWFNDLLIKVEWSGENRPRERLWNLSTGKKSINTWWYETIGDRLGNYTPSASLRKDLTAWFRWKRHEAP
jgi:hypothetical protein